jgi:GntR family transcriptional regulator
LIVRQRGVGTTVVDQADQRIIHQISTQNFWDWFCIGEKNREIALLEIAEIACPAFLRKALNIQTDNVVKMRRVMSLGGEPIAYFVNYFPTALLEKSSYEKFHQERFLKVLYKEKKFDTLLIDQKVQASTADMDLANALNIRFGEPVFFIEAVYRTDEGTPVGLTHMYHRGDRILLRDLFTTKGSDIR